MFAETRIQLCIVHMVRTSLHYVNWKEHKGVAADLKAIYRAATERLVQPQCGVDLVQQPPLARVIEASIANRFAHVCPVLLLNPSV
ncbi:MAG: transposase [Acidobacteriaceae bacterium]|nr:transposase [Acidobacteriaceae bacterium]